MIDLLEEIADRGFGSAAFLTYGADLGFFESKVMTALQDSGCRNIIVVADGHQLKDALNSAAELRYVGVQYPLIPVRLGNQAFHPKAILLAGEKKLKVMIGSGNLTLPGYTRNWEIFTKAEGEDATALALDLLRIFEDAASRSALNEAFVGWRQRLEKYSTWLFRTEPNGNPVALLSSTDGPILPRVSELLGGREVHKLLVVSPFFDREAAALKWLVDHLRPRELRLLATHGIQLDSAQVEERLAAALDGRVLEFLGESRSLHGKALLFEGPWGEALLAGSPNLTSAAMLRTAGTDGNFELATFQEGEAGAFSPLFEDKIGLRVNLTDLHPRRPIARGNRVAPLELEAVWIHEASLHTVPAGRGEEPDTLEVRLERRGIEVARHYLGRDSEKVFTVELDPGDLARLEGASLQARRVGGDGRMGSAVWIQNLDAVQRRANPVQRPRYAGGLQGLSKDSLGLNEDAWNNLFDAFLALSRGWGEYAKGFKPEKIRTATRPTKPEEEKDGTWNPESFYVVLEDVRIELPAYFARVENSGWAIGDFEYLITALPTAGLVPLDAPSDNPEDHGSLEGESQGGEDAETENGKEEGGNGEEGGTVEDDEETKERRKRIADRLFSRFRTLVKAYEESLQHPAQSPAEATLVSSLYTALHLAFARAASADLLSAARFRELVSRLTYSWTEEVWTPLRVEFRDEVEKSIGCATISLAATAAATSNWAREHAEDQDEYDAEMFSKLVKTLREIRPIFLSLKSHFASGEIPNRWTKAAGEYDQLSLGKPTPLSRFDALERRYEIWHLDDRSALQRALRKEGLDGSAELDDSVLRIHAPLPNSMRRKDVLRKLLYLIRENIGSRVAVVWTAQDSGTISQIAMTLEPEQKAVLETTRYTNGNFLLWRHRASSGTSSTGVNLTETKTLASTILHRVTGNDHDVILIKQARELVPDLFR